MCRKSAKGLELLLARSFGRGKAAAHSGGVCAFFCEAVLRRPVSLLLGAGRRWECVDRCESLILVGERLPGVSRLTPLPASGGASVGSDSLAERTARTQELVLVFWFFWGFFKNLFLNFGCASWQIAGEERP